ncbi:pyruvate kinase, partial [Salmonella enterica subsp. enterica serovar Montevideo]|nr:pyruvate kinase [Salmonella enterica subsp. enterica serovar Montevideo]
MIPQISQAPGVVQLVLNFLQALEQQGFTGDTATSYADRLTMSTDNSIYQLLPDAVVFPRSTADVALLARLAAEPRFTSLIFTPRGGGTGTNGQALNQGIIVSAETAAGQYPSETVAAMARVCLGAEKIPSINVSKHRLDVQF